MEKAGFGGPQGYKPLPRTRFRSFFYYSGEYFFKLVVFGALGTLFFLPWLFWTFASNYSLLKAAAALDPSSAAYADSMAALQISGALTSGLVSVPLSALFFAGLAGAFHAAMRISTGRFCTVGDFFKGIKECGLRFALAGLVFGLSAGGARLTAALYSAAENRFLGAFFTAVGVLQFILVSAFTVWYCTQTALYKAGVWQIVKNSVRLAFGKFLPTLAAVAAVAAPYVLTAVIPSPFNLLAVLVLTFLYIGFASLGLFCFAHGVFDKTINPALGKEYVGRGLEAAAPAGGEKTTRTGI